MGRLWVKGVVAGAWQGWVGFWGALAGMRVDAEGGGSAYGGEFLGVGSSVFDVFSMCWQGVDLVFGSWTGV